MTATTALDVLSGALRNLNVLASGEALSASDAADALQGLNDLLDSLSTEQLFIPYSTETILAWTPGQYRYTVGNPQGGTLAGTLTQGSPIVSGVILPPNLIVKGDVTSAQAALSPGTTILSLGPSTLTLSAPALFSTFDVLTYTVPGDFKIARPLRIRSSFTRITSSGNTGLDYWFPVENLRDYIEIGYKGVSGPWPTRAAYQTTMPYGTLFCYPNPVQGGELHLWTDALLEPCVTVNQPLSLPQGYARALKKLLAIELAPEYGKQPGMELLRQAKEARDFIRSLNEAPVKTLHYDTGLWDQNRKDAGWIMHGGFR